MAQGLGFIEFTTGDVLSAAAANGYLASQTVMVFADAAARTSAITTPYEGMFSYLKDTNATEYYTGSAWAALGGGGGGGGKVLQVVNASYATRTSSTTSTYADTGLTATITPTAATSKILVIANQNGCGKDNVSNTGLNLRLMRGATSLSVFGSLVCFSNNTNFNYVGTTAVTYLDSPATTSATTYKTQQAAGLASGTCFTQADAENSTITLMEIGA